MLLLVEDEQVGEEEDREGDEGVEVEVGPQEGGGGAGGRSFGAAPCSHRGTGGGGPGPGGRRGAND